MSDGIWHIMGLHTNWHLGHFSAQYACSTQYRHSHMSHSLMAPAGISICHMKQRLYILEALGSKKRRAIIGLVKKNHEQPRFCPARLCWRPRTELGGFLAGQYFFFFAQKTCVSDKFNQLAREGRREKTPT